MARTTTGKTPSKNIALADETVSEAPETPRASGDHPAGYHVGGTKLATLTEVLAPSTPTMSLAELTEQREQAQSYPEVILVEGLFDYAALWEAGFQNVTCSLGTHLNRRQFRQLCDRPRTVYLTFDADSNGSGQQAAQCLSRKLQERGTPARLVSLPEGHDPNSFFVQGGDAREFHRLLEEARL